MRKRVVGLVEKLVGVKVVEKSQQGVLYDRLVDGEWRWFKNGNEKTDGKYVGKIRNGLPNGQGTYTSPYGRKYVGEWKDGKYDGQGTSTTSDGREYVGEYKEGKPWNVKGLDKNGNIIGRWVNGVKQ